DLNLVQSVVSLGVASGAGTPGTLTLANLSDTALHNLAADLSELPSGWNLDISDLPATLAAHASTTLHYTLTTPAGTATENFQVGIHSDEGASDSVAFDVVSSPVAAHLVINDSALKTGVVVDPLLGAQKLVELTIENTGQQTANDVTIVLPPGLS